MQGKVECIVPGGTLLCALFMQTGLGWGMSALRVVYAVSFSKTTILSFNHSFTTTSTLKKQFFFNFENYNFFCTLRKSLECMFNINQIEF
jgi:hypothetical protein